MGVPHAFPVHIPPYPQISPQQSKVFKPYQAPSTLINHPPFLSGVGGVAEIKEQFAKKQATKPKCSANLSLKDVFADDDMGDQACLMCHL